jgi:hypothetical protein
MKKLFTLRIAALKPRNPFAALARERSAGTHAPDRKRQRAQANKDLVQRLREAGL